MDYQPLLERGGGDMAGESKVTSKLIKAAASGMSMDQLRAMVRRDNAQNPDEAKYAYIGPYLTKIDNLSEALEFYATNKSPNTVVDAGSTVLRQIEEEVLKTSDWRDLKETVKTELTYLRGSQGQFRVAHNFVTVDIGYVTHIGRVTLEYEYLTDWNGSEWVDDGPLDSSRGISAHTIVYLSFNDEFKYDHHPEQGAWWNFWHETFTGEVARISTLRPHLSKLPTIGGTSFFTKGEFKMEFDSFATQSRR
jgi:hypothetical protein